MSHAIEDYALIGNCETAALVARNGSIDWLCLPRFDGSACFAALLGDDSHGHYLITPDEIYEVERRYRDDTLVLETVFTTENGSVRLVDCMSRREGACDIVRRVEGLSGTVLMRMELIVRFDYGATIPWVSRTDDGRIRFVAGPDRLMLQSNVKIENQNMKTTARFLVAAGQVEEFALTWSQSFRSEPALLDAGNVIETTADRWAKWVTRFTGDGPYRDVVVRSLIVLKALTHYETGGIVAAPTTSLPEQIGGPRNWDYRFCWLRDATLTLYALMECNFIEEAISWRQWLIRAVAGSPEQLQIMYGIGGERRLDEWNIPWLPGYEGSSPVHVGNAAAGQVQLDVYGEILEALYYGRKKGLKTDNAGWNLERALIEHLAKIWREPDDGIWEQRGGRKQFTHSKVMAWVAVDRAIKSSEEFGLCGPVDEWRILRDEIHAEVCKNGYDAELGSFVQTFDTKNLDAALLMIPLVGFLPATDERVQKTVAAIENRLMLDGYVLRYENQKVDDGLPGTEGVFLACSFWLADVYVLQNRVEEARSLFLRLVGLCNDVGLLAEEYDPRLRRQIGNFPQAFSHLGLINTAFNLSGVSGLALERGAQTEELADVK